MDLIFDTETTGFYKPRTPPNAPIQPDLVQLAALLVDGETILSQFALLVLPQKKIDPGAQEVHGRSMELLETCAVPRLVAVRMFNQFVKRADVIVAHNTDFDTGVMATAYARSEMIEAYGEIARKPKVCTMKQSAAAVGIPGKFGKSKWPTLEEAYEFFMGVSHKRNAHDAMEDTLMCHKILCKMRERGVID